MTTLKCYLLLLETKVSLLRRKIDDLDQVKGQGKALLVDEELFQEELEHEGKGEDVPVPAEKKLV